MINFSNRCRSLIWLFIILYVASLPYAILVFEFLRNTLTLNVVKALPLICLLFACLIYVRTCRKSRVRVNFSCLLAAPFLVGLHAYSKGTQFPE